MLEILKTFDMTGIAMGATGDSYFGSMKHISFLILTEINEPLDNELSESFSEYQGEALVRITMPIAEPNYTHIKSLKLGDKVNVKGFLCANTDEDGVKVSSVFYGTCIERSD